MERLHISYDELGDMPEWLVTRAQLFFSVLDKHRHPSKD